MRQVHVNVVSLQPTQCALDLTHDMIAREPTVVRTLANRRSNLRRDDNLIALALDRLAQDHL
jgi:hypothetical protein